MSVRVSPKATPMFSKKFGTSDLLKFLERHALCPYRSVFYKRTSNLSETIPHSWNWQGQVTAMTTYVECRSKAHIYTLVNGRSASHSRGTIQLDGGISEPQNRFGHGDEDKNLSPAANWAPVSGT
jgi:hypothetical protein